MMFYWCTLVLLTLVPVVTGDNTGVKLKLTQRGLDYVAGKAIEKFKQHIKDMDIPDQTLPIPFKQYTATGIKINLNGLNSEQKFVKDTGVIIKINSPKIHVTGNLISGKSSPLNVDVDTLTITATVAVKRDKTGHLTLNIEKCETKIGTFTASTGSRLLDAISGFFSVFPSIAGKLICSKMTTRLADFNPQLATLNDKVREFIGIDFSMEPTVVSSDSIELSFVGLNGRKKRRLLKETKDSPEN